MHGAKRDPKSLRFAQRFARRPNYGVSRNILLVGLAGLVTASFSVLGLFVYVNGSTPNPSEQLEIAMRLMRKGESESPFRIAKAIDSKSLKKKVDLSKREFLLGANERNVAEGIVQQRIARAWNERAVRHLEKSRELTFPEGYEGLGNYYLGLALFDLFRWEEAENPLEVASERWPQGRADAIERLVDIDMSFDNQDPVSALERIDHWRSLPRSSADEMDRTAIKEMQVLYAQGDYKKAADLLETIPSDSPQRPNATLVRGRCMQKLADSATEPERSDLIKAAMSDFQRVLASTKTSVFARRQSNLELARSTRNLGNATQAVSAFSALRLSSPFEPESLVSGLDEIDSLIDLGRISDAADTLEHITKNFGELKWYENNWMQFSDMRKQIVSSGERMIDSKNYKDAARFARFLPPLCDESDQLRMNSRLYELWARSLEKHNENALVRSYFILSAEAYEALSVKWMRAPEFEDLLWHAIENYRLSGSFKKSNLLLENYMRFEPRENQPKGLMVMARNYNAMEQPERARMSLNRILESNTSTPLIYDARLEAAKLSSAGGKYQEAEDLVTQNLSGDLTPASPIWRDSLFLLGEVLYLRGLSLHDQANELSLRDPSKSYEKLSILEKSYDELIRSIVKTEEGLMRFDDDPRRLQTLYKLANAYKMASSWPELLLTENRNANEDTLAKWRSQRKELLNQSKNAYSKIVQHMTSGTDLSVTNPNSESLLRNSYFGVADLLYEAGDYEEAIVAYQETAMRFISEPESLEAMTQVSNSQKKLGKFPESRRTLEMAKDILTRIPTEKDARFMAVTSHDRKGWEQYIQWLMKELEGAK